MARIRSQKPELRDSRVVASWPFEVRYFFTLLWGYLDDYGRGNDMPKRIAGDCFPHDDITAEDIDKWLNLMTHGIDGRPGPVCRYEVAGVRYVHCINWSEHQKPNRPSKSRIPKCPLHEGLSEGDSEALNAHAVLGAAEQQSRGAGEQQQPPREPRTEPPPKNRQAPPKAAQAVALIVEATGTEPWLAADAVNTIAAQRKPRNLPGLIRTLIAQGEIQQWLDQAHKAAQAQAVKTAQAAARASPECAHGQPGGDQLHPISQQPFCPLCRKGSTDD